MDIVPGRENNKVQPERNTSVRTEMQEKVIERPSVRRPNEPMRHVKPAKSRFKIVSIIIGIVIALAVIGLTFFFFNSASTASTIDSSKFQAVFFTNGQVYFGKLHTMNNDYMNISDVYYLQTKSDSSNLQKTSDVNSANVELVPLVKSLHGPENEMIISKDQIIFFENLKNDSVITRTITQYEKK